MIAIQFKFSFLYLFFFELVLAEISPYGLILIPGMAKKLQDLSGNGFDYFAVHVEGRVSSETSNAVIRKVIDDNISFSYYLQTS